MSSEQRILIIDGHPDPTPERFVHHLAAAYQQGAEERKHTVICVRVADLTFPLLRAKDDYQHGDPPDTLRPCLDALEWATHVVILYPLWLGAMPALLKALLEQIIRPGFAFSTSTLGHWPVKYLRHRSARIVVTMGMPVLAYRLWFRAGSSRSLHRAVLATSGFRPVRTTLIGRAEALSRTARETWSDKLRDLGRRAR
jgi:putative NADPH-quinone reductase